MAGFLQDAVGATHRAGTPALKRRALVNDDLGDNKVIDVDLADIFRVRDSGDEELKEGASPALCMKRRLSIAFVTF